MAKITNPLFSFIARGTLAKALTFRKRGRDTIAEKTPTHIDKPSAPQLAQRVMYQQCTASWHDLTAPEKQTWESQARRKKITGYNYYMSLCLAPNPGIYLPLAGGTMSGDIAMATNKILALPSPTLDTDADTKGARNSAIATHTADPNAHHNKPAFYELASAPHSPSANATWENWTLTSIVPVGTISVLVMCHNTRAQPREVGTRKTGSSLSRLRDLESRSAIMVTTPLTATRIIQVYAEDKTTGIFSIWGYWL